MRSKVPVLDPELNDRILGCLAKGRSLNNLGLERQDGRWLVRGLCAPRPIPDHQFTVDVEVSGKRRPIAMQHVSGRLDITMKHWKNIHFHSCDLQDTVFWNCRFADVVFERCDLRGTA